MSDYTKGPLEITAQVNSCHISGFYAIRRGDEPPTAYVACKPDAQLYRSAPELLDDLRRADALINSLAGVVLRAEVREHIPHGLAERLNKWLRDGCVMAIAKAEGRS